jgi:hypothetical protein
MTFPNATAYHEAGHVVLAYITGVYELDGDIVTVGASHATSPLRRDAGLSAARELILGPMSADDYSFEEAIIAAGGSQAERLYLQKVGVEANEKTIFQGAHGDLSLVRGLLGEGRWFDVCARASLHLEGTPIWNIAEKLASAIVRCNGVLKAGQATDVLYNACTEYDVNCVFILR